MQASGAEHDDQKNHEKEGKINKSLVSVHFILNFGTDLNIPEEDIKKANSQKDHCDDFQSKEGSTDDSLSWKDRVYFKMVEGVVDVKNEGENEENHDVGKLPPFELLSLKLSVFVVNPIEENDPGENQEDDEVYYKEN